jgi:hypothetical protein
MNTTDWWDLAIIMVGAGALMVGFYLTIKW